MNNTITANILRFILLGFIQIFLLKDISIWGHASLFVYLGAFLLLPINLNPLLGLTLGFLGGGLMDLFYQTTAIHAAACTFMMFLRPNLITALTPRNGYELNQSPSFYDLGWPWFILYSGTLTLFHILTVMVLEIFTLSFFRLIMLNTILSALLSWITITSLIVVFGSKNR